MKRTLSFILGRKETVSEMFYLTQQLVQYGFGIGK